RRKRKAQRTLSTAPATRARTTQRRKTKPGPSSFASARAGKSARMRVQVFAAALAIVFTGSAIAFAATGVRAKPDLVVSSISHPPSVVFQGHSFQVRDSTRNRGGAAAGRTVTQYYLRSDNGGAREP